jgi:hypothetical protein
LTWDKLKTTWRTEAVLLSAKQTKLEVNGWSLPQVRIQIFHLDRALREVGLLGRKGQQKIKAYRGLAAQLSRDVYGRGRCVLWGSYSSVSTDMGIATGYAGKKDSAIFTIEGIGCIKISRWSRFAGEEEYLYPPNSKFVVKEAVTEEQAEILGKKGTQLFGLENVSELAEQLRPLLAQDLRLFLRYRLLHHELAVRGVQVLLLTREAAPP